MSQVQLKYKTEQLTSLGLLKDNSHNTKSTSQAQTHAHLKTISTTKVPEVKVYEKEVHINGKVHKLPLTKGYILKEYKDVFTGIGTPLGSQYHIKLKQDYKPVQHPPRPVPVKLKPAYKTELMRLVREGIITLVKEHTPSFQL